MSYRTEPLETYIADAAAGQPTPGGGSASALSRTLERVAFWSGYVLDASLDAPRGWRIQNMLTLAGLIAQAALEREESRGVHFRSDFPKRLDVARHTVVRIPPPES